MKRKISQTVLVLVLIMVGFTGCAKTTGPSLPPELFLDSDGDGFNDWFEVNIAGYNPDIPNDRYIILYFRMDDEPGLVPYVIDKPAQFFIEKGKVPPENIITLVQEEADYASLERAINWVAQKSDENDLVFLSMSGHGVPNRISGDVKYTELDKWLDRIEAMVVIVAISACDSESALPVMKDGPCPRIVYAQTGGEFIGTLGTDLRYFTTADAYGNEDGYVSIKEAENYIRYPYHMRAFSPSDLDSLPSPHPNPPWGVIQGTDASNIASQIYLTDYNPAE